METALEAGISVQEFWALSMRETYMTIRAAHRTREATRRASIENAWYGAAFARMRELPKLSNLFSTRADTESRARESAKLFTESQEKYDVIG